MKKYITLLFLLLFKVVTSQIPQIQWSKCFGGSANDYAYSILPTTDGGYIICGSTASENGDITSNHGDVDGWIVKTDANGNIDWQKTYGGAKSDLFKAIIQVSGEGYIVCGETSSADGDVTFNHGMTDFWIVRIDQSGNILWQNTYGGSNVDLGTDIAKSDSGYFAVGQTFSDDGDVTGYKDHGDGWLISIDNNGTLIDEKSKGGSKTDIYNKIITSSYGGFVVCGYTFSNDGSVSGFNHGGSDAWLIKLGKSGALQWMRCFGDTADDGAYKVIQDDLGNYVVSGWFESNGDQNTWFLSTDSAGDLLSDHKYGGDSTDNAGPLFQNYINTYVVASSTISPESGNVNCHIGEEDIWMYETETDGGLNWQKCVGGTGSEHSTSSFMSVDSTYVILAYTSSTDGDVVGNHGEYDWWLVKLEPGCSVHADFSYSTDGNVITFTNNSVNDSAWFWNFGDGFTSTDENPLHEFPGIGAYDVCLIATAGNCLPDTICITVHICGAPAVAAFTTGVFGNIAHFTNTSLNANTWLWNFGDGTTSTESDPNHIYATNGIFLVCLVATDEGCSSDTFCTEISICDFSTVAAFTYSINGGQVSFFNTSASATTFSWSFGDGSSSSLEDPVYNYTASGTYEVCLAITDGCGSDTTCLNITVCLPPITGFDYFATNYLTINFIDESENSSSWQWLFGDGGTSSDANPVHNYTTGGTYEVCLITTNSCGSDTLCSDIVVQCPPFDGAYTFTQSNDTAFFTSQSSSGADSWHWDFGDGNTSLEENPVHVFQQNGVFTVCLIVSDGCSSDTVCQEITVIGVALTSISGYTESFIIYPNPVTESGTIQFLLSSSVPVKIELLAPDGRILNTIADRTFTAGTHKMAFEKSNISWGIYLVRFTSSNGITIIKLMVQ